MKRFTWVGIGVLASCTAASTDVVEQASAVHGLEGTIEIDGCTPSASDIRLKVARARVSRHDHHDADPDDGDDDRHALGVHVTATADPHVFAFRVPGAQPKRMYRLGASLAPTAPCAPIAWRGPAGHVTVDGTSLSIAGYAMRTQIEVLAHRGANAVWVGIDAVDLGSPDGATREFRWRTDIPNVTAAAIEVVADNPPPGLRKRATPVFATWQVPVSPDGWAQIPAIDLAAVTSAPACPIEQPCPIPEPSALDAVRAEVHRGAPFYIRVRPIVDGNFVDDVRDFGIVSTVKVVNAPHLFDPPVPTPGPKLPPASPLTFHTEYSGALNTRALGHNGGCYTVIEDHQVGSCRVDKPLEYDGWGCFLEPTFGPTIHEGSTFCLNHGSGGFFSQAWDTVTGLIDGLGELVDDISHLYEEIKQEIVKVVAQAIDELGIVDCDGTCQAYLMAALDAALAAMGLPPSLPNWQELKDRGIDYLEDYAAEESGIDKDLIDEARQLAAKALADVQSGGRGDLPSWIIADDGFRPQHLLLTMHKTGNYTSQSIPSVLQIPSTDTYFGTDVLLPRTGLNAGRTYTIPVQLVPNFMGIDRFQHCFYPGNCVDVPPLTGLLLEDTWFHDRFQATPFQAIRADAKDIGPPQFGSIVLNDFGRVLCWFVPREGYVSDEAFQPSGCR